jgi:hypothetical protein
MRTFYGHPDDPENPNYDRDENELSEEEISEWENKYDADKSEQLNQ